MTWEISIRGQVQGVGFRPFIWREAQRRNFKGSVANGLQGLVIKLEGSLEQVLDFQKYILEHAPETARITGHSIEPLAELFFDNFTIEESARTGPSLLHLTPDVALCKTCRSELKTSGDRRYRYAFTTCTVCGPRYSILLGLPYDRGLTTMRGIDMCPDCLAEYNDPSQHRYFAQTNSCPACGIRMQFFDLQKPEQEAIEDAETILRRVTEAWQSGAIVAIKGIGGYLLTCDATNSAAITKLRQRKNRPGKPFALMYPDITSLQADAQVPQKALECLQSTAAPIVLLQALDKPASGLDLTGIAPGLEKIGAMLPNAPLFELLLQDFRKPIVATSGNISQAPLVFEDETAMASLSGISDYFLTHNRRIVMPQDDSVLALTASGKSILLRRGRGLAPAFFQAGLEVPGKSMLALGAEMKSTFTLAHLGQLNISQYLGELGDFDTQQRFEMVLNHLLEMFRVKPEVIIGDLHPEYYTTQLGRRLAQEWKAPFLQVQHHFAHFTAVLAENGLFKTHTPVLGIIWDGTGFGSDGQIWGGEFLVFDVTADEPFRRSGHFEYFPWLLGDKMAKEPRLSALSGCRDLAEALDILRSKFTATEWNLYQKLMRQENQKMSSSAGRIFDAVASLLGLADKVSFEGEAAMLLEALGRSFCRQHGYQFESGYEMEIKAGENAFLIPTASIYQQILNDLHKGLSPGNIAAKFHFSMVLWIEKVADFLQIKQLAFSGGVFQNTLLLDMIEQHFSPDYQLFFHRQLSPNDENISFGQWAYATFTGKINPE